MAIHTDPGREIIQEDPLLPFQLLGLERQHTRRCKRQQVARHTQRFPCSMTTSRCKRLERTRPREMQRIRACELRASYYILNGHEWSILTRFLQCIPRLLP